jgi:hypothetical protein
MKRVKKRLDYDAISRTLGTRRVGKVESRGGYFGALALAAEAESRFRTPSRGGRATDPRWTERRQVAMTPETLAALERASKRIGRRKHVQMQPMQLAALLLEQGVRRLAKQDLEAAG